MCCGCFREDEAGLLMWKAVWMALCPRIALCEWPFVVRLMGQEELAEDRSEVVDPGVVLSKL